ncbi:DUF3472 domain-containing protein [Chitinophaga nivalis]|uniref:DUF3472 domain-containing protein n=1 Tax=Chitinophaga nivalis TaxID=2991709 RepID=A0ABT3IV97_9BACT|nr:DUF3472 domain-containing protein [Chitinophaga nivalis]MCW3462414.1 DUF3472 domain-containing protein [Chitinophaga nivalis]MCW3487895.1 DUF3472 domain-containing protein [Chitinophaga nivalis]
MNRKKMMATLLTIAVSAGYTFAQTAAAVLPGFTAYADPLEENVTIDEAKGIINWTDNTNAVNFYFHAVKTGPLKIALMAKSTAPNKIKVSINGTEKIISIPNNSDYEKIPALQTSIKQPGFYCISLKGVEKTGNSYAEIQSVTLEGAAAQQIQFNPKPWRRAASVHLNYPVPEGKNAEWFYGEIKVPAGEDKTGTYFMSCGFHRGYFGMQVNSPTERRIIFSVWDAGGEPEERSKVKYEDQVVMLAKGDSVIASGFGGEGTGGHSHWVYNWQAGATYRFLMHSVPTGNTTTYTAYFYVPEHQEWKLIASFRAPKDGKYMGHLYSFLENFSFENGHIGRKGYFGNHWIKTDTGEWIALTKAKFTNDATARAKDRIDYGGGVENGWFYLWNSGFKPANAQYGDLFERPAAGTHPEIVLPRF